MWYSHIPLMLTTAKWFILEATLLCPLGDKTKAYYSTNIPQFKIVFTLSRLNSSTKWHTWDKWMKARFNYKLPTKNSCTSSKNHTGVKVRYEDITWKWEPRAFFVLGVWTQNRWTPSLESPIPSPFLGGLRHTQPQLWKLFRKPLPSTKKTVESFIKTDPA